VEDAVGSYLEDERPNLLFVHIADADFIGHRIGWMTPFYGRAVRAADAAVGEVIAAADEAFGDGEYTVIVTADHGGSGRDHGALESHELIPWIVWGEGVDGTGQLHEPVSTMDTGATALWLLGIDPPSHMHGRPVESAFRTGSLPLIGGS